MITKIADALDRFLFGETTIKTEFFVEPVKVRIVKPGEKLGMVTANPVQEQETETSTN
jgi:hypothetical protein